MRRTLAGLAIGATAALALATPAQAHDETQVCPSDLTLRSVAGQYPDVEEVDLAAGTKVVSEDAVDLTKPTAGVLPGSEFVIRGLDLEGTITVDVKLSGGASTEAGAIRVFYYDTADPDTIADAPTDKAIASGDGTLTIAASSTVRTVGFTYDGSNNAGGTVTFSNLKVGDVAVKFTADACKPDESPSPSPTTAAPSTPGPAPTTAAPGAGGGVQLPVTGTPVGLLIAVGGALAAAGVVAWWMTRRRRVRFTA